MKVVIGWAVRNTYDGDWLKKSPVDYRPHVWGPKGERFIFRTRAEAVATLTEKYASPGHRAIVRVVRSSRFEFIIRRKDPVRFSTPEDARAASVCLPGGADAWKIVKVRRAA